MLDLRKNLIERRMIELDPDYAKHYLNYNTYATQRTIRPLHVLELSKKMKNGLFRFGEIGFAVMPEEKDVLINGQHVCSAAIESGITVPCILEKFKIKDAIELSEAFRQFEILPRSLNDMVKVEANALGLKWPLRISSLIVSAASLESFSTDRFYTPTGTGGVQRSLKTKYMSKDDKVNLLGKYLKEGTFLAEILMGTKDFKDGRHIGRAPVVLIMFKTWRKDPSDAYIFWSNVRDGEELTRDMPEMKLREFLKEYGSMVGRRANSLKVVSNHEYAYRCAVAWNAFRAGGSTRLAYFPNKGIPKLI